MDDRQGNLASYGTERHGEGGFEGVASPEAQMTGEGEGLSPPATGRLLRRNYPARAADAYFLMLFTLATRQAALRPALSL